MSTRYRVFLCNAVIQSGSQTTLATIAVSAGRSFVGIYAATTAGEAGAALRLSSPLADCVPQVLRRGHVRRLRSRAPASARLRQRAVLRRMPIVLKLSRYGQRIHAHAAACAAARVSVTVLSAVPSAPLFFVSRLMFVCTVCQCFGQDDIGITDSGASSRTDFPTSYLDAKGRGWITFTTTGPVGFSYFTPDDYEVWSVSS